MPFALTGLVLAWAVMLLCGAQEFDRGLQLFFDAGNDPRLAASARWVNLLGGTPVLLAATGLGAAVLLYRREWRSTAMLVAITLSGRLLVSLQKGWTEPMRPEAQVQLVPADSLFPSGHAANATMVWLGLALLLPTNERGRGFAVWAAVWLALAVGVSQVMLRLHWPSYVIGGWAFGLFWTLLLFHLSGLRVNEGTPPPLAHSSGDKEARNE